MSKEKIVIYINDFTDRIEMRDALRGRSQFNSFEDLIGFVIEDVFYDEDGNAVLTVEKTHAKDN